MSDTADVALGSGRVVRTVPAGQAATIVGMATVPALGVGLVAARTVTAALIIVALIWVIAVGAYVSARRFRLMAGPGWIATETVLRRRVVSLDHLASVKVGVGGPGSSYVRLGDTKGGLVALNVRTTLPPVRAQVLDAVTCARVEGRLVASEQALNLLQHRR